MKLFEGKMRGSDWEKWAKNLLIFAAPTLAIFFSLLSQGVEVKKALPVALLALWGACADFFKKYKANN